MPESQWQDPIVEEVRQHRAELFTQCGNSIRALAQHLRNQQASSGHEVVSFPPRLLPKEQSEPPHEGAA